MTLKKKVLGLVAPVVVVAIPFLPVDVKAGVSPSAPQTTLLTVQPTATESIVPNLIRAGLLVGGSSAILFTLAAFLFRRVVSTNTVHIVQKGKDTVAYGANLPSGNVYYEIPTWVPNLGVSVIRLPVSNFDLSLQDYEAYDEDRVPFLIDVTAFFRISDPTVAAQRITNTEELKHQLSLIVQGAVRKVLASDKIDNIMTQRSTFGDSFSNEVKEQLIEWGVSAVRNMELMDIRDTHKSTVIASIQAKKTSEIERDGRIKVAENNRLAKVAEVENKRTAEISEVEALREINLSKELSEQQVGERAAARQKAVGVANELSIQDILLQKATTKEKDLAVLKIEEIRTAEIERDKALVLAEKEKKVASVDKERAVIQASQQKETTILVAEGKLESEKKAAEAIQVTGVAKAEAEKALQLAPVSAQIALSQEIGNNESYQKYLILIEAIRAHIEVGTEQAKSLQSADVKVIANGGSAPEGVNSISEAFSSKGGTALASAIEALAQSDFGAEFLKKLTSTDK